MRIFQPLLALSCGFCILSAAAAQDKKLTTVNVGYSAISGSFAPLWVGFDQGLNMGSISRWPTSRATGL